MSKTAASERWVELGERISVCARSIRERIQEVAGRYELSPIEFTVLFFCRKKSPPPAVQAGRRRPAGTDESPTEGPALGLSQNQIATAASVSAAHVSGLVEQLRAKGLLAGQRSATDRRRQHWEATAAGEALLRSILEELSPWAAELDKAFGLPQTDRAGRLLDRLSEVLSVPPAEVPSGASRRGAA